MARGLTTPSKPYIPKDDPSTPAVVISDAALRPAAPSPDRTRITQTIPGQTRSSPIAAPIPLPPAPAALVDDEPLPELRGNRRKGPLLVAGVVLLGGAAFVALRSSGDGRDAPSSLKDSPAKTAVAPAAPAVSAATAAPASAAVEAPASAAPVPRAPVAAQAPERPRTNVAPRAEAAAVKPLAKKSTTNAAPRKTKSEAKSTTTEPGTSKPKGVIVRETPF